MAGKCFASAPLAVLLQVDQVVLDDAGPDDVDADHVEVRRAGRELLAQQRQVVGGAGRRRVELDRVAVLARPVLGVALAEREVVGVRSAGDRDLGSLRAPGRGQCQSRRGEGSKRVGVHALVSMQCGCTSVVDLRATLKKSLAAHASLLWAVRGVANPRHSWGYGEDLRLAAHPKPGRAHPRGLLQRCLSAHHACTSPVNAIGGLASQTVDALRVAAEHRCALGRGQRRQQRLRFVPPIAVARGQFQHRPVAAPEQPLRAEALQQMLSPATCGIGRGSAAALR